MENQKIKDFIEKIELESKYRKILKEDFIYQMIAIFSGNHVKQSYPNNIEIPLEIALQFYKNYNVKYYNMIIKGIETGKIIINKKNKKSFVDTENNVAFIKLNDNDGDLYMLVHEFAHFIDKNSNPKIVPNEYWFLSETFAFYIEKKLETYLKDEKYKNLISTRTNNRIYFESKMLDAIENELYYEKLYNQKGKIDENDIDISKIKSVITYAVSSNVVNYLLQYPLANILSDYLVHGSLLQCDHELVEKCINTDLYDVLSNFIEMNKNLQKMKF